MTIDSKLRELAEIKAQDEGLQKTIAPILEQRDALANRVESIRSSIRSEMLAIGATNVKAFGMTATIATKKTWKIVDEGEVTAALTELGVIDEFTRVKVELKRDEIKVFAKSHELPGVEEAVTSELRIAGLT